MTAPVARTNLAVNYSPQAVALARSGDLHADYFKCPPWPELLAEARSAGPIYVHFNLELGDGSTVAADWTDVGRMLDETQTRYLNVHVAPRRKDFPQMAVDSAAWQDIVALRDRVCTELDPILKRFDPSRVIIENAPYRGEAGSFPRPAIVPDLFTGIINRTGCGLLLDIGHAAITAQALGMDVRAYLADMPAARLAELHASGVRHDGERWRDHMGMTDDDWGLLDWSLEQVAAGRWARPWMLTYEYGGLGPVFEWRSETAVLAADMPRFRQRVLDSALTAKD